MKRATLQIGMKEPKEMSHDSAYVKMMLLRGGQRFSFLVALSLFLGSFGLLLMASLKAYELKSETKEMNASINPTNSNNTSTNAAEEEDK